LRRSERPCQHRRMINRRGRLSHISRYGSCGAGRVRVAQPSPAVSRAMYTRSASSSTARAGKPALRDAIWRTRCHGGTAITMRTAYVLCGTVVNRRGRLSYISSAFSEGVEGESGTAVPGCESCDERSHAMREHRGLESPRYGTRFGAHGARAGQGSRRERRTCHAGRRSTGEGACPTSVFETFVMAADAALAGSPIDTFWTRWLDSRGRRMPPPRFRVSPAAAQCGWCRRGDRVVVFC